MKRSMPESEEDKPASPAPSKGTGFAIDDWNTSVLIGATTGFMVIAQTASTFTEKYGEAKGILAICGLGFVTALASIFACRLVGKLFR